jgi:hypothetical protein
VRAFDPSATDAARWRSWLTSELGARGVPTDASLELRIEPVGEAPVARLSLDACWPTLDGRERVRGITLVPARRLAGRGWPGWPAYQAAIRLLREVDAPRPQG